MVATEDLTPRGRELLQAFVTAWRASEPGPPRRPFNVTEQPFAHPNWPTDVAPPRQNDDEARQLIHRDLLQSDRAAAPAWVVFPTDAALKLFGAGDKDEQTRLADPDKRLAIILQAATAAHQGDPSQPIHFSDQDQSTFITHPHWPLQPNAVRYHDLSLLEGLGLIGIDRVGEAGSRSCDFWPTPDGRRVAADPLGYLDAKIHADPDSPDTTRLSRLAERLRASDIAVGAGGDLVAGVLRGLAGL